LISTVVADHAVPEGAYAGNIHLLRPPLRFVPIKARKSKSAPVEKPTPKGCGTLKNLKSHEGKRKRPGEADLYRQPRDPPKGRVTVPPRDNVEWNF
jgi:hypothetical protein